MNREDFEKELSECLRCMNSIKTIEERNQFKIKLKFKILKYLLFGNNEKLLFYYKKEEQEELKKIRII